MKVHFVGIGGIGVSALARYYLSQGWQVSGSDLTASEITDDLQKEGVLFFVGHNADNVPDDANKIIYSAAVKEGNPELVRARSLEIFSLSYAQALGELTRQYITFAISGSHGKSTTTALLSLMMIKANLDPTVIIGTRLKEFDGKNFRLGKSRYLIIEADEWANSFHHYYPAVAVITNIDKEHLDTFGSLRGVIKSFNYYLKNNISKDGKIIINSQDKNSVAATKNCGSKIIYYDKKPEWPLKIPGNFNQLNAEAAWQAAKLLGVSKKDALAATKSYQGSWRRSEQLTPINIRANKSIFYSDYAHHPTEIKAVGLGLKEKYPNKKIVLIFQPHQVERLTNLFNDFAKSFKDFDEIGILPAYEVAGRELTGGKTSKDLVKKINPVRNRAQTQASAISYGTRARYLNNFDETLTFIGGYSGSIVVFMGAGDIDNAVRKHFKSKLL